MAPDHENGDKSVQFIPTETEPSIYYIGLVQAIPFELRPTIASRKSKCLVTLGLTLLCVATYLLGKTPNKSRKKLSKFCFLLLLCLVYWQNPRWKEGAELRCKTAAWAYQNVE